MTRGADILVKTLKDLGVKYIFTLSGNQIMPVFDAAIDSGIELIHVRHEAAAVHMADAWGRLTGLPGVALVTAGPGFANTLSALYVAQMAESPLILISGGAPSKQLGRGPFQEMQQADMARPVTKHSYNMFNGANLAAETRHAWDLAMAGRPGPIHISVPIDSLNSQREIHDRSSENRDEFQPPEFDPIQLSAILDQLEQASRPLILTGPATWRTFWNLRSSSFWELTHIPVVGMTSPRGVNDPCLGAFAESLSQADCVLLLGKKLDFTLQQNNQPIFSDSCRILQLDAEQSAIELTHKVLSNSSQVDGAEVGDVRQASSELVQLAHQRSWRRSDWSDQVCAAINYRPSKWSNVTSDGNGLHAVEVCRAVQQHITGNPGWVFVSDGGEFGQWAQACVKAEHRIINGPSGSIGSSIPFALAAQLAIPHYRTLAMLGDGTFGFHPAEFDTAIRYRIPFIAVVGNDATWNAEHQIQLRDYGPDRMIGCDLLPTRYDKVATAFGGYGEHVAQIEELGPALERAERSELPACINVAIRRVAAPVIRRG